MGVFRPIVQAFVRAMFDAGHDIVFCGTIGPELVGDHHAGRTALSFQELSYQTLCGLGITAALDQNVEDEAILIDGTPEPVFLSTDGDDRLVEVPFVAEPAGRSLSDIIGKVPAEFRSPKSHGLVRDDDATGCQHILDHM